MANIEKNVKAKKTDTNRETFSSKFAHARWRENHRWHPFSVVALLLIALALPAGCRRVPQVTTDAAVFKELDALYTAVTARNPQLLQDCRLRMEKLHADKRLEPRAYRQISGFVETAEKGEWKPAAESLYRFMRAQRKRPD